MIRSLGRGVEVCGEGADGGSVPIVEDGSLGTVCLHIVRITSLLFYELASVILPPLPFFLSSSPLSPSSFPQ